eukprot:SAG11_NODE_1101_length_5868_cov_2.045935_7_plen_50_part_00
MFYSVCRVQRLNLRGAMAPQICIANVHSRLRIHLIFVGLNEQLHQVLML